MEIFFLGVGEACDARYPNTSLLLNTSSGLRHVLLDCGFTTPHLYFKENLSPNELEVLWISHFHGDHFFGVPLLLLRFWEMRRHKPLHILGPRNIQEKVFQAMDLAYPNFRKKLTFPLQFNEVEPTSTIKKAGLLWSTAENQHSERSLAIRISDGDKSLFYSGDGRPSAETSILARGCHLVVHEAFRFNQETPGHSSIKECLAFAKKCGVPNLALIHLERHDREKYMGKIKKLILEYKHCNVFLPEPGSMFFI